MDGPVDLVIAQRRGISITVLVGGLPVEAELESTNKKTVWVRLPESMGGRVIKRRWRNQVVR